MEKNDHKTNRENEGAKMVIGINVLSSQFPIQAAKEEEPDYMDEAMKEDGKKAPAVAAAPKKSWDLPESDVPVGTIPSPMHGSASVSNCVSVPGCAVNLCCVKSV